jgi:hypothetical protein
VASESNSVECLRLLLEAKADPDTPNVGFCVGSVGVCIYACVQVPVCNTAFFTLFIITAILVALITILISMNL